MQVRATKNLYYGIIRKEGTVFTLQDTEHFDDRVMEKVTGAAKRQPDPEPKPEQPDDTGVASLAASNADASKEAAKPVPRRRRSTADTKG